MEMIKAFLIRDTSKNFARHRKRARHYGMSLTGFIREALVHWQPSPDFVPSKENRLRNRSTRRKGRFTVEDFEKVDVTKGLPDWALRPGGGTWREHGEQ